MRGFDKVPVPSLPVGDQQSALGPADDAWHAVFAERRVSRCRCKRSPGLLRVHGCAKFQFHPTDSPERIS